ncbi:MAG: radical SAM protein [Candidatus Aureabacteria bacterium]|nr:radical SAM protein [Candidatus Auribacterota bacterium]
MRKRIRYPKEACFISTYRCNAKCVMCGIWQKRAGEGKEIGPSNLKKLPSCFKRINISGGEPSLRDDLPEIVEALRSKSRKIDISTNGYLTEKLVETGRKFPDTAFRISLEGMQELNDRLRGLKGGFEKALESIEELRAAGVGDIGLSIVISDKNKNDLLKLYRMAVEMDLDLSSSVIHNSFYFNKFDNRIENIEGTIIEVQKFIGELLRSKRKNIRLRVKDWGRAFIDYGIIKYIKGENRPIVCSAAKDFCFLDPYGNIMACNGSDEPWILGNIKNESFDRIWFGDKAREIREKVLQCRKKCWMVGSARPAMRSKPWIPVLWIIKNKIKLSIGRDILNEK